jgi:hypothetical protein
MMDGTDATARAKASYSLLVGAIYMVFGGLQVGVSLGLPGRWADVLLLGGGFPDGLVLVLVGAVFLKGERELSQGLREGVAFVYMGIALALFFAFLEVAEIGASLMGSALIGGGDYAGYDAWSTMNPALTLSPIPIAGLWAWRKGFSLLPRGVPPAEVKELNNSQEG